MTRRDKCWKLSVKAHALTDDQAARAWRLLALELEKLGEADVPKFRDLVYGIVRATYRASHPVE